MDTAIKFLYDTFTGAVIDIMAWVVFSLLVFEFINHFTGDRFYKKIENSKYSQPFWAALMGSIPGCGGPILLTNLYVQGTLSMGSLTASFIATFGDAAFVILSVDPLVFLWLLVISLIVGLIVGYLIDFTPLGNLIDKKITKGRTKSNIKKEEKEKNKHKFKESRKPSRRFIFWDQSVFANAFLIMFMFIFPATILDIVLQTQGKLPKDIDGFWLYYSYFADALAVAIILIFIPYFFTRTYLLKGFDDRNHFDMVIDSQIEGKDAGTSVKDYDIEHDELEHHRSITAVKKYVFLSSIFIMTWVFFGLFIFGLLFYPFPGLWDSFFGLAGGFVGVLIAVFVGMIPGCGPQIAFASFYLGIGGNSTWTAGTGPVSDSAIAANSINQDGDASFPLLALDRSSFVMMRLLNAVPAIITGGLLLLVGNGGISFHEAFHNADTQNLMNFI